MLWWWKWVDQSERWQPYEAIRNLILGEDLRAPLGRPVKLQASTAGGDLWARAWSPPGRVLGYMQSPDWGQKGGKPPSFTTANLDIGMTIASESLTLKWWDADRGERREVIQMNHPGGQLRLQVVNSGCRRHLARHVAFKSIRELATGESALLPFSVKK